MHFWKIGSILVILLIMMSSASAALIAKDPFRLEEGDTIFLKGDDTAHTITAIEEDMYVMLDGKTVMGVGEFDDAFESAIVDDDRAVFVDEDFEDWLAPGMVYEDFDTVFVDDDLCR